MDKNKNMPCNRHVFLIGRPPLGEYLGFMKVQVVGGEQADISELSDEWRSANDHIQNLEKTEKGIADNLNIEPIPSDLGHLIEELKSDPAFLESFSVVPFDIGIVELDHLVVYQKHINLDYVEQLKASITSEASMEELFRFGLLGDHPKPKINVGRVSQNSFIFNSPSTDLRYLDVALVEADQIQKLPQKGRSTSAVTLLVGYGSNLLNVIQAEDRLILNNGSHRAYALRDLGIAKVPCIIQKITRREEIDVIGSSELKNNPERYLEHPRPSVLKDYFDPKLRKIADVPIKHRQVKISFGVDIVDVPIHQQNQ